MNDPHLWASAFGGSLNWDTGMIITVSTKQQFTAVKLWTQKATVKVRTLAKSSISVSSINVSQ